MQLAINDATAAAATATETPKSRAAMDEDDQGPATSDDTEDERERETQKSPWWSGQKGQEDRAGQADHPFSATGPGRPAPGRGGPGSLTTTNLDGSTNCQPPGWAVARLISCCPARKLKCSLARVKAAPTSTPSTGCLLLLCWYPVMDKPQLS